MASPDEGAARTPLSLRQIAAVRMLVAGRSTRQVAQELGVHRRTLWRWGKDPDFKREIDRRLRAI